MIVRSSRRPTPAASSVRPATEREAHRRHRLGAALTAFLVVTAVVALTFTLHPALQSSGLVWWLAGYALPAGFWGGYRAADAQPVHMPGSQP